MPGKDAGGNAADVLRKIADKLEAGEAEDEWGPILWLLGRSMSKRANTRK